MRHHWNYRNNDGIFAELVSIQQRTQSILHMNVSDSLCFLNANSVPASLAERQWLRVKNAQINGGRSRCRRQSNSIAAIESVSAAVSMSLRATGESESI